MRRDRGSSLTSAKTIRAAEDTRRVIAMRLEKPSPSLRQIAQRVDRSLGWVHKALTEAIEAIPRESAEELLDVRIQDLEEENARLKRLLAQLERGLRDPDSTPTSRAKTIETIVKASKVRIDAIATTSKLEGSAAPTRTEVNATVGEPATTPAAVRATMQRLFGDVTPNEQSPDSPKPPGSAPPERAPGT
jgi:hypothetical protein